MMVDETQADEAEKKSLIAGPLAKLDGLSQRADAVNIFNPLAYFTLCRITHELSEVKPELEIHYVSMRKGMSGIASSIMFRKQQVMSLRLEHINLSSQLVTLKAFAFGVFALYVSLISLAATVLLGVMSLL